MPINTNLWNQVRYAAMSPLYDRIAPFRRQRKRALELLALRPGERVLPVGAGTGLDLPWIPAGVFATAIDITPAMLERLRRRAEALDRRIEVREMDGQHLTFPAEHFDAVILHLILSVIPDPAACIREVDRVLRPNGRVVVFDKFVPDKAVPSPARRLLNIATNLLFSDITRRLGPMLAGTSLAVVHEEPAAFFGAYKITVIGKQT